MKRTTVWLLTMALFLTMLAGCRTEDRTDQTKPSDKKIATTQSPSQSTTDTSTVADAPTTNTSTTVTTTTVTPDSTEAVYFNEVGDFTVAGRTLTENVAVNREGFCIPNTEDLTTYLSGTPYTVEYHLNYPIDPDTFAIISSRTQPNYGWVQLMDESENVIFTLNISEKDYAHDTYPDNVTPRSSRIGGQEVTLFEGMKWGHSLYRYGEFQIDDLYIVCATYDKSRTELVNFIRNILSAVQLHPLYQKYPEYFNVDGMKGVEVYVWQMAGNLYHCGALTGTNRLKTEEEIRSLFDNGATMAEMRTILECCEVEREMVTIIPVHNPLSSFWYEINEAYQAQLETLFWDE